LFVELGIVLDDKAARAAHQEQAHQVLPIFREGALFKGSQAMRGGLKSGDKIVFRLTALLLQPLEVAFGADMQVLVLVEEEAKLVADVGVLLVVRRCREKDDAGFVALDVVADGFVAFAFAIAQVVALVNDDQPVAW
jgi:hypothetical protein